MIYTYFQCIINNVVFGVDGIPTLRLPTKKLCGAAVPLRFFYFIERFLPVQPVFPLVYAYCRRKISSRLESGLICVIELLQHLRKSSIIKKIPFSYSFRRWLTNLSAPENLRLYSSLCHRFYESDSFYHLITGSDPGT